MKAALLPCLMFAAASACAAEPILGFNFPDWSRDGYASGTAQAQMRQLAATGATWVALTPTLYVKDRGDSVVAATDKTPSDDALRAAIRAARAQGLKVVLKPHVDVLKGGARAWINPKDAKIWFASYRTYLLNYARIAREENCSLFVVGTELALLSAPNHWSAWRSLIKDVRAEYSGPLTYAANWHSAGLVGFWRELDFIGIDAYYPVAGGTNRTLLRVGWAPISASLHALAAANGRPILFTEFGLASQKGANLRPWDYSNFGALDLDVQAAYVQTFLDQFSTKSWVAGFLNWDWEQNPGGPQDKSMTLRGKPALGVFTGLFRSVRGALACNEADFMPAQEAAAARARAVMAGSSFLLARGL
ncbi:MAG: glycoside hydrolase family 113 [Elusimicrobiota bacterium]